MGVSMWNDFELNFAIVNSTVISEFQGGALVEYVSIDWTVTAFNVFGHEHTEYGTTPFDLTGYPLNEFVDGSRNVDAIDSFDDLANEIAMSWVHNEWDTNYQNHPFMDNILTSLLNQFNNMDAYTYDYSAPVTLDGSTPVGHLILEQNVDEGIEDVHARVYFDASERLVFESLSNPNNRLIIDSPSDIGAVTVRATWPDGSTHESTKRIADLLSSEDLIDQSVMYIGTLGGDEINTNGLVSHGQVYAGDGNDSINVEGNYWVTGADGHDVIDDSDEGNSLYGDYLASGAWDDTIYGNGGDDRLSGGAGDDELWGGQGNDRIFGDNGDDQLHGEEGTNELHGGSGNDNYWIYSNLGGTNNIYDTGGIDEIKIQDTPGRDSYRFYALSDRLVWETAQGTVVNMFNNDDGSVAIEEVSWWNADYRNTLLIATDVNEIEVANFIYAATTGDDFLEFPQNLEQGRTDWSGWSEIYLDDGNDYAFLPNTYWYGAYGGTGNDTIIANGSAWIEGQEGNDSLDGSNTSSSVDISGGTGDDTIIGGSGDNELFGDEGHDQITDGAGRDTIDAGDGDDLITNLGGVDIFDGGAGNDTLFTDLNDAYVQELGLDQRSFVVGVDFEQGLHGRYSTSLDDFDGGGLDQLSGIENFRLRGNFSVHATGDTLDNRFVTDEGDDTIFGGDGGDTIISGAGNDSIIGGAGHDWITPGVGNDYIDGGALEEGNILFYEGSENATGTGVYINNTDQSRSMSDGTVLSAGTVRTIDNNMISDEFINVGNFHTSEMSDEYHVDKDGYVFMRAGDDVATVYGADVRIFGGSGNDTINGRDGADIELHYYNDQYDNGGVSDEGVHVQLTQEGRGTVTDSWGDVDTLDGVQRITGSQFDDTMEGSSGVDTFSGDEGNDSIVGNDGNDVLRGGDGNDSLRGGSGNDVVSGGAGNDAIAIDTGRDTVSGGSGDDWFHIWNDSAYAVITDYEENDIIGFADNGNHFRFTSNFANEIYTQFDESENVTKIFANTAHLSDFEIGQVNGNFSIADIWNTDPGNGEATFIRLENNSGGGQDNGSNRIRIDESSGLTWDTLEGSVLASYDPVTNTTTINIGNQTVERSGYVYIAGGELFNVSEFGSNTPVEGDIITSLTEPTHETLVILNAPNIDIAREAATALDGHLLEVDSDFENDAVGAFMRSAGIEYARTGITDIENEGIFVNARGDAIGYDDFGPHEPNDWQEGEDFVDISTERFFSSGSDSIGWNDSQGDWASYIVEFDNLLAGASTQRTGDLSDDIFGDGSTVFILEDGDDRFQGTSGDDTAGGSAGEDSLFGAHGDDLLSGGDGNDYIEGDFGEDSLYGGHGNDTLLGGDDRDTIIGGEGNDSIVGGDGDDRLRGQDGNDTILGGGGWDNVQPGRGSDYVDLGENHGGNVRYDIEAGEGNVWDGDINTLALSAANGAATDQLTLVGRNEAGQSIAIISVDMNASGEVIVSQHPTGANTSNGDVDTIIGAYEVRIDLGGTDQEAQLVVRVDPWNMNLRGSLVSEGRVNVINGTQGNDDLSDTDFDDLINASGGDDYVEFWGGGNDTANLGDGDDVIWPEGWDYSGDSTNINVIDGGNGFDVIHIDTWGGNPLDGRFIVEQTWGSSDETSKSYRIYDPEDANQDWTITLHSDGSGTGVYNNFNDREFLRFSNVERVEFNAVRQTVDQGNERFARFDLLNGEWENTTADAFAGRGSDADETLEGTNGEDLLEGFGGNDVLHGRGGSDILDGGSGNDTIYTGIGNNGQTRDEVYGGTGDDEIHFGDMDASLPVDAAEYISEEGNDTLYMNNVWGWLRYDVEPGNTGIIANMAGGRTVTYNGTSVSMDEYTIRDQFGDVDTIIDSTRGVHLWGTEFDDILVTDRWFWWSVEGGDDIVQILRNGPTGTLEAHWETAVDWAIGSTEYSYVMDNTLHTVTVTDGDFYGLKGGSQGDRLRGDANDNELYGDLGNDTLLGEDGNDRIYGGTPWQNDATSDGNDSIHGGRGDDEINGGTGADTIIGGEGNDTIYGDAGDDYLRGTNGNDEYHGGQGVDIFAGTVATWESDSIEDYEAGEEIIFEANPTHDWDLFTVSNNGDGTYTVRDRNVLDDGTFAIGSMTIRSEDPNLEFATRLDDNNSAILVGTSGTANAPDAPIVYTIAGDNVLTQDEFDGFDGIMGLSEPGTTVYMEVLGDTGPAISVQTDQNGQFHFTREILEIDADVPENDTYILRFYAQNGEGILSEPVLRTVTIDLDEPGIEPDPEPQAHEVRIDVTDSQLIEGETAGGSFDVSLGAPVMDGRTVEVVFTSLNPDLLSLDTKSVVFTASNWDQPQTISVSGIDGSIDQDSLVGNISGQVITNDLFYYNIPVDTVHMVVENYVAPVGITEIGTSQDDTMTGTQYDDFLAGEFGNDQINGLEGDDFLAGGFGSDTIFGGDGRDDIVGGYNPDVLGGGEGNDTIDGEHGNDTMFGDGGNDSLHGDTGDDLIEGGAGDDTLNGGVGADTMIGGAGNDTYYVDDEGDVIDDQGGEDDVDTVIVTQTIRFTLGESVKDAKLDENSADSGLVGNTDANFLEGNSSNNELDGGDGDDRLYAGDGDDTVLGGEGNDEIVGGSGEGDDIYDGGNGIDTITYTSATAAISVNLTDGRAASLGSTDASIGVDQLSDIENIIGGGYSDSLTGNSAGNEIYDLWGDDSLDGLGGNDVLFAATGRNTINGGDGNDRIYGGYDDDHLLGGNGNDVIVGDSALRGSIGQDTLEGGRGNDLLQGSGGADVFVFNSNEGTDKIGRINDQGTDVIARDFDVTADMLDVSGMGYASAADALQDLRQNGNYVELEKNGTTVQIYGLEVADLNADHFDFG